MNYDNLQDVLKRIEALEYSLSKGIDIDGATTELEQIYCYSSWFSAKYMAAKSLGIKLSSQLDLWLNELLSRRKTMKKGKIGVRRERPSLHPIEAEHLDDREIYVPVYGEVADQEIRSKADKDLEELDRLSGNYIRLPMLLKRFCTHEVSFDTLSKDHISRKNPLYIFRSKLVYGEDGFIEAWGRWSECYRTSILDVLERVVEIDLGKSLLYKAESPYRLEDILKSDLDISKLDLGLKKWDKIFVAPNLRKVRAPCRSMLGEYLKENIYVALYECAGLRIGNYDDMHVVEATLLKEPIEILSGILLLKTND